MHSLKNKELSKEATLRAFLDKASTAYHQGTPIISDDQFDYLEKLVQQEGVGFTAASNDTEHLYPMYSLQKYYVGEVAVPLADYSVQKFRTPKLDGAAISLLYVDGMLTQAVTRGDGKRGQNVTDKFIGHIVPMKVPEKGMVQVTGEIVAPSSIQNARNYASGALNLKDIEEFKQRNLEFIAYGVTPGTETYNQDLNLLTQWGFHTVLEDEFCKQFPWDGSVIRLNSNKDYYALGFTSKHPRGAYALKERKVGKRTILRSVIWQTGKSGRVTPVAVFDPVELGGAIVTKATLNNVGFIQAMDLSIGDTIEVVRSGEIIPQVLGKVLD